MYRSVFFGVAVKLRILMESGEASEYETLFDSISALYYYLRYAALRSEILR
jgi:hypothetical protein